MKRQRRSSLLIGRIAGIDLRIHLSFVLLVALVLAAAGQPDGPTVTGQMAWLVILFGGVLLHELGHSLVARSYGVQVSEIELLPIGGVSKLRSQPRDPHQQLTIAIAGPAASLGLAVVCALLALTARLDLWPPSMLNGPLLVRGAWANLMLAGFNLVPAFPLDGGRVLRAYLAERTDDTRATYIAAKTGRRLAIAMMILGAYLNLWLLIIGVFIYMGSWAEEASARVHTALGDLRVRDVMTEPDPSALATTHGDPVSPDTPLDDNDLIGSTSETRAVAHEGRIIGVVRRSDIQSRIDKILKQPTPPATGATHGPSPPSRRPSRPS